MSSTRRHSSARSSASKEAPLPSPDSDKKPKLMEMKGMSVVKTPFMATDKPHYKEKEVKEKAPKIIDRPRFSMDAERPVLEERKNTTSSHHRSRGERTHRKERDEEKRKAEEEKEARRFRRETEKQMEIARVQVAEESRLAQEKEDEERRARRAERRRKREEAEKAERDTLDAAGGSASGGSRDAVVVNESETERNKLKKSRDREPRERVHRHSHRREREREREREKEKEKEKKNPLSTLWSTAKKVFN